MLHINLCNTTQLLQPSHLEEGDMLLRVALFDILYLFPVAVAVT